MSNIIATDHIVENLRGALPTIFSRKAAQEYLGRIINARTLANLDCQKKGPPKKYLSKTVVYERDSFLDWLSARLSDEEGKALKDMGAK